MKRYEFKRAICILTLFCAATVVASHAQTIATLVNFDGTNGSRPTPGSPLVQGTDGNLYGVTYFGGTGTSCFYSKGTGCGTFFKMSPAGELSILHNFALNRAAPTALTQ